MRKSPVRRILLSVVGTVSTVVLMLALKPHTHPEDHTAAAAAPSASSSAPAAPSAKPSASRSPSKKAAKPSSSSSSTPASPDAKPSPARSTKPAAPQTRTVTGSAISTRYGTVQVRITLSGDRITASAAVQCPSGTPRSKEICGEATPTLNAEAVAAQSADIASVSGATYTSDGYKKSLQSAIDRA